MSYLIYFGIVVAGSGVALLFVSDTFAQSVSRVVEAVFDFVEYHLALRARERQVFQRDLQIVRATQFCASDSQPVVITVANRRSTQQRGVARIAA